MNPTKTDTQKEMFAAEQFVAHIIGACNVNNELLADFLTRYTGTNCQISASITPESIADAVKCNGVNHIILFDCFEKTFPGFLGILQFLKHQEFFCGCTALYNLDRDTGVEKRALKCGIHGFFYRDENLNRILVGMQTICNGGIWVDKDVLARCIHDDTGSADLPTLKKFSLTSRHIEILAAMVTGSSNKEIAKKLSISPHTIKSHLYCIYQIISVSNRLQAAAWAEKHLPHLVIQKY
jgi:LuxR family transcriptional regulator of csgAB operon